jgi:hypothetical protein
MIHCVKATVPLLSEDALVRQGDRPYDERYFTILKKVPDACGKKLQATEAGRNDPSHGENQYREFSYLGEAALHDSELRAYLRRDNLRVHSSRNW